MASPVAALPLPVAAAASLAAATVDAVAAAAAGDVAALVAADAPAPLAVPLGAAVHWKALEHAASPASPLDAAAAAAQ